MAEQQDWFSQNAPAATPPTGGGDWFAANSPAGTPPPPTKKLGALDYHPHGTEADPKYPQGAPVGTVADTVLRPAANAGRALLRTPGQLLSAAKEAISGAPNTIKQSVQDFKDPKAALRRDMGISAAPDGQPLPENTDKNPGMQEPDYDRELPNLIGSAAAQYLLTEGALKVGGAIAGKATPGALRRTAQNLVGIGDKKVASLVADTVEKAGEDADKVRATNKKADETTLYKRGVVDEKNANTAGQLKKQVNERRDAIKKNRENAKKFVAQKADVKAENEKTVTAHKNRAEREQELASASKRLEDKIGAAKVKAEAENNAAWTDLRTKTAGGETDVNPIKETVKVAAQQADPASSPVFNSILRTEDPSSRPVTVNGVEIGPENISYDQLYEATWGEPPPLEGEGGKVNFDRLQRWYSYISNRMYGGGRLEGGTYNALKMVRQSLDNAMGQIAEEKGATDELAKARELHTQKMETFSDSPNQPQTVASKSLQETSPEYIKEQQQKERLAKLTRYDPEIGSVATHVDNLREGVKALPKAAPLREQLTSYPPEPARVAVPKEGAGIVEGKEQYEEPEKNTPIERPEVNLEKVRKEAIGKLSNRLSLSGYDAGILASSLLAHPLIAMFGAAGEGLRVGAVGYVAGKSIVRTALESPRVIEWLSAPRPGEIEAIRKMPNIDRVKLVDGLTEAAVDKAKRGTPVKLAADVVNLIGPHNVALIAAANRPQNAGEAKKRAKELQGK